MIATFKTPTLRNLAHSQPYMHNGAYPSLDAALSELMRLSDLARAGRVREADDGLAKIRISDADIRPLAAFLNALNEDLRWGTAPFERALKGMKVTRRPKVTRRVSRLRNGRVRLLPTACAPALRAHRT